MDCIFEI